MAENKSIGIEIRGQYRSFRRLPADLENDSMVVRHGEKGTGSGSKDKRCWRQHHVWKTTEDSALSDFNLGVSEIVEDQGI